MLPNLLALLNQNYRDYGQKIGWVLSELPIEPQHDGSFHIEINGKIYFWVVTERGLELERRAFEKEDLLLEHIFIQLCFWAGVEYEVKNRDETKDSRRKIHQHQLQLIRQINVKWADTA